MQNAKIEQNELGATIESVSGEVPRRPILVVEYPAGMSMHGEEEVENTKIAMHVIEQIQAGSAGGSGVAIPVEFDIDGQRVASWSLLKSPGWRVYQLLPPQEPGEPANGT